MTEKTTLPTPLEEEITPENAREVCLGAALSFKSLRGEKHDQQRLRLLDILQNRDCRDVLGTCVKEVDVIGAFLYASFQNDIDLLEAFHDIGMNVDAKDRNGDCALINASKKGHEESVRWLLDHRADVDMQGNRGWTALMHASTLGETAVVELLLQRNANFNVQSNFGSTALMLACRENRKEIVQLLLTYEANIDLKNSIGQTALDLSTMEEVKQLLMNHVCTNYVLK